MSNTVHRNLKAAIESLEMSQGLLDDAMKKRLLTLGGGHYDPEEEPFKQFDPSELDALFTLVKTIQAKVVTDEGEILANATTRDIASLTGSITSLLRAFASHQQKIDEAKELADLKEAVLAAIMSLPKEAQDRFFAVLKANE